MCRGRGTGVFGEFEAFWAIRLIQGRGLISKEMFQGEAKKKTMRWPAKATAAARRAGSREARQGREQRAKPDGPSSRQGQPNRKTPPARQTTGNGRQTTPRQRREHETPRQPSREQDDESNAQGTSHEQSATSEHASRQLWRRKPGQTGAEPALKLVLQRAAARQQGKPCDPRSPWQTRL